MAEVQGFELGLIVDIIALLTIIQVSNDPIPNSQSPASLKKRQKFCYAVTLVIWEIQLIIANVSSKRKS